MLIYCSRLPSPEKGGGNGGSTSVSALGNNSREALRMALAADKAACVAKEGTPLVAGPESLPYRRKRVLGLLLAVLSALIASIDPLLTRFVRLNTDTDAAVIAWKYLAVGSILLAFVQVTSEDNPLGLIRKLHASKAYLHLGRAALLIALHNLLWTMAVLETSIGHAIAIAALAPLWSVLICAAFQCNSKYVYVTWLFQE